MASRLRRIIPMMDRILVKRAKPATESKGGILLPEKAKLRELEGVVVAVGPGLKNPETGEAIPLTVEPGDHVLLPEYGGRKVELEDKEKNAKDDYYLFREADILAKLEE